MHGFLDKLPIVRGLERSSGDTEVEESKEEESAIDEDTKRLLSKIMRSKGFCWLADSHIAANYWSHTVSTFECECLGRWWAALPREQWPEESKKVILSDFDSYDHVESNDNLTTVGDRRQEIVIIGPGIVDDHVQGSICKALDECLLLDDEFDIYKTHINDESFLKSYFTNPMSVKMATF